ncbi:26S proteasome regulatory subunit rpn10 [Elsinoe australis]|uniref:26S proteasome regulatory subunit rpn10 n=1 Tax=Elsinoe australis TaxID=40998 RepID=A0A4U7B2P8_9PEZI|nr:26S proteasome regulatory subunit rpn10 [Elsinoe australis]
MGLEATMIVVDNSESSRNGDYVPSRWEAQADCVNLIFQYKTQSNPESSVGLMSMGGSGPEVLTTLTTNPGKVLDGLHRTKIRGQSHLHTAIMVAQLALKHRQNKSQRQRIIVFTCSDLSGESESQSSLVKLAKKMKKNNVSVDIVALGELGEETVSKLRAFNEAVKGGDGSHLEVVHPGPNLLSDVVVGSPILAGEGGGAAAAATNGEGASGGGGGGGGDFEFGVDPSMDPELALALRMSMEEENARQEREKKAQEDKEGKTQLESVPEGKEESQPLLGQDGQPSGSGSADKKDDKKDDDKMDTA